MVSACVVRNADEALKSSGKMSSYTLEAPVRYPVYAQDWSLMEVPVTGEHDVEAGDRLTWVNELELDVRVPEDGDCLCGLSACSSRAKSLTGTIPATDGFA